MPNIPPLTSLRFFAAFALVLFHMGVWGTCGFPRQEVLAQGVSFFFVLSGFILTYTYSGSRQGWGRYYLARFARIWPVHAVTFLASLFLLRDKISAMPEGSQLWVGVLNLALVQSWIPVDYIAGSYNGVSWSISNEAFFYLLCPLMLHPRFGHAAVVAAIAMGCAALAVANQHFLVAADPSNAVSWHIFVYMGPLVRIIEFSVGVLAAKAFLANRSFVSDRLSATVLEVGLLAGIVVASVYYLQIANILRDYPAVHYWARMTSGTVLFAIAVYVFASNRGWLSQALSHPVLVRLGEISFAFYMSHQFILARTWQWSDAIGAPAASFLTIVLCLSVAYAIWRFVEAPARRLVLSVGSDRPLAARAAQKSVAMPRS